MGDDKNHIHLLVSFHPKYSIGEVVRKIKSITARELFKELPQLRQQLRRGEFWADGYYASTVGTGGNWRVANALLHESRTQHERPATDIMVTGILML